MNGYKDKFERLFFTLAVLTVYRFATFVTLPGLDLSVMGKFYSENSSILGIFNSFSGGAISRMSIMALNLIPYVSANIITQLLTAVIPEWKELKRDSHQQKQISRYSRLIALFISFVQSAGIAIGLESVPDLVLDPGLLFKFTTILSIMSGSILVMWLAECIKRWGICDGSSAIIFTGIICSSVPTVLSGLESFMKGDFSLAPVVLGIFLAFQFIMTFCELVRYFVKVYFKTPVLLAAHSPDLNSNKFPVKMNVAGVLPAMFADSMMIIPSVIVRVLESKFNIVMPATAAAYTTLFIKSLMIMFFCVFCIAIVMNPEDVSENLQSRNAYIEGVPEGTRTALFFKKLLNKISMIGCLYMLFAAILPDLLSIAFFGSKGQMMVSGTSILIVIGVALEIYERMSVEPPVDAENINTIRSSESAEI